jgi:hypothetical protein
VATGTRSIKNFVNYREVEKSNMKVILAKNLILLGTLTFCSILLIDLTNFVIHSNLFIDPQQVEDVARLVPDTDEIK